MASSVTAWCVWLRGMAVLAGMLVMPRTAGAHQQQIWFTASPRAETGLYAPDAAWRNAAAHVAVINIYASHLHEASDGDLRQFFAFLNASHIKLALEFGPLNTTGTCGPTEGFGGARMAAETAKRIARLGGRIDFVAMDEPYWFGHVYAGPRACHWGAGDIARNMQPTLQAFRAAFPLVVFGDIEPVNTETGRLIPQYAAWLDAWQKQAGAPPEFFHADVNWSPAGQLALAATGKMLALRHIRFGVIYDGDPGDFSDAMWLGKATSRFENFEDGKNPLPDDVIFQSWNPFPRRLLPESNPAAFTHLILSYSRVRTRLHVTVTHDAAITGSLRTQDGQSLARIKVQVETPDAAGAQDMFVTGQTPPGAAAALVGWRANTECACDGIAKLRIKTVTLQMGNALVHPATGSGLMARLVDATLGMRFDLAATQQFKLNSQAFPTQGNETFRLTLQYVVTGPTTDSVLCDLIFLNKAGRELSRIGVNLAPPWRKIGQALTDTNGNFTLKLTQMPDDNMLRVNFQGDNVYRATRDEVLSATMHN